MRCPVKIPLREAADWIRRKGVDPNTYNGARAVGRLMCPEPDPEGQLNLLGEPDDSTRSGTRLSQAENGHPVKTRGRSSCSPSRPGPTDLPADF